MDIELSEQQKEATKLITEWWEDKDSAQIFYLAGFAGTGKTTLIKYILPKLGIDMEDQYDVAFGAYTGKAALVMRRNEMPTANTIHSMIYVPYEDEDGVLRFRKSRESIVGSTTLVVLDECSMISDDIARDLASYGTKILVLGDPGQLPAINGEGFFTKINPNYFLTEIHRQAENNPIIMLSKMVREGKKLLLGDYGEGVRVIDIDELDMQDIMNTDQVLTGKNDTRRFLNNMMKEELGFNDILPLEAGIKLVCLKNQHDKGLLNGMLFETFKTIPKLQKNNKKFFTQSIIDDEGKKYIDLDIIKAYFDDYRNPRTNNTISRDRMKNRTYSEFDYGYALTVHKSQGSQWENIIIYDDGFGSWDDLLRARWLYTAITRAQNCMTIMR